LSDVTIQEYFDGVSILSKPKGDDKPTLVESSTDQLNLLPIDEGARPPGRSESRLSIGQSLGC
jgi:hypothetical protein